MMESSTAGAPVYEYATYPRQFVSYKWYKPLIVALLTFVFMLIFQLILLLVSAHFAGGIDFLLNLRTNYDDLAPYDGPTALALIGGVATMLPSLALAALIVRDRPFSSYSTSRGGWNWSAFGKCLIVALIATGIPFIVQIVFFPDVTGTGVIAFTVVGALACLVLVPIQCLAEEYVFRGFVMQAVGAWTRLPVFAIVVSALVFAAGHPYNLVGIIAVFINGVIWGIVVWQTKGLEATGAAHIVNNLIAFGAGGLGLTGMTSEIDIVSLVFTMVVDGTYAAIVIYAGKKYNWFAPKGDGVTKFNEKRIAKMVSQGKLVVVPAGNMPPVQPGMPMPPQQVGVPVPMQQPAMPVPMQQPAMPVPVGSMPPMQPGMPVFLEQQPAAPTAYGQQPTYPQGFVVQQPVSQQPPAPVHPAQEFAMPQFEGFQESSVQQSANLQQPVVHRFEDWQQAPVQQAPIQQSVAQQVPAQQVAPQNQQGQLYPQQGVTGQDWWQQPLPQKSYSAEEAAVSTEESTGR